MHGRGLDSVRWRFALAATVLTVLALLGREFWVGHGLHPDWREVGSLLGPALLAGMATYAMARRLTNLLAALQRSADAIAAGDVNRPVDVDCACEIGGLAHSFRQMTTRLNANILRINTLAYSDAITGLPNRAALDRLLAYAMAPERQGQFRAAIVFIDLDGFKRINDTLGHDAGDEVLRLAARRLLERGLHRTLQTLDTCADEFGNPCQRLPEDVVFVRFAGDEFVGILPGVTDREVLADIGRRLIDAMREPFRVHDQEVTVGASVGIAITPEDTTSAAELLAFADQAMYSGKQAGKARCMFFDRQVRERLVERTRIEAELRHGLRREELVLHFQPQVNARTLELDGLEALVRWQHPERGLLSPATFIDVAEQAGLMVPLGRLVLRLAVLQCRRWLNEGRRHRVSVNVSPAQFNDPAFVDTVIGTLHELQVPSDLIAVEITESMAMTDFSVTAQRLSVLRAAGVRVAVDDFGIGYSNLAELSNLPMDELKIDRSLVCQIGRSRKHEAIIQAIVGMAQALGYHTIAEGVETPGQLQFIAALGCEAAQGFLFGRPMAPAALGVWCAEHAAAPRAHVRGLGHAGASPR